MTIARIRCTVAWAREYARITSQRYTDLHDMSYVHWYTYLMWNLNRGRSRVNALYNILQQIWVTYGEMSSNIFANNGIWSIGIGNPSDQWRSLQREIIDHLASIHLYIYSKRCTHIYREPELYSPQLSNFLVFYLRTQLSIPILFSSIGLVVYAMVREVCGSSLYYVRCEICGSLNGCVR